MSSFIEDLNFEGKATGVFSSLSACNLVQQSISVSCAVILKPTHPPLPGSLQNFQSRLHSPLTSSQPHRQPGKVEEVDNPKVVTQVSNSCCWSPQLTSWSSVGPASSSYNINRHRPDLVFHKKLCSHVLCVLPCRPSMSWCWTVIMQHTQFVLIWCQP